MDEATRNALFNDIRFALRKLDPWPPKDGIPPSETWAKAVLEHLALCRWEFTRLPPRPGHSTPPDPMKPV